jgi:CRP/FNR family transcriptional regulator
MSFTSLNENAVKSRSTAELLHFFRQRGELKDYSPETELFHRGQAIREIHLIERGLVKFTRAGKLGHEMVVMLRSSGDLLGAAAIVSHRIPQVTGRTLTECQIYSLSTKVFQDLVEVNIEFSRSILQAISRQLYEQTERLAQLGTSSARARLAHLLLQLIPESGYKSKEEIRLELPISKVDIAGLLAITPEHLSRKFGELEEMGIIRRSKGWVYVRNLALLSQESE